jgi:cytochrome c oxidase subunit 2
VVHSLSRTGRHLWFAGGRADFQQQQTWNDWTDPNAQDDLVRTNELVVPVGRPVVVYVSSKDVIHNFAIYTMRVAQDAIPGSRIPMWFTPIKAGEWEIICGQLCGTNHYAMKAIITAVPATEFEEWLKQADQNQSRNP